MTNFSKTAKNTKQLCYTCLTNLSIKLQNVISMISFRGLSSPINPLTRGFTPGPHSVLRPQTHTITTAKQFVQKFKFIVMKMHKNCCHQSCSFWLRYAPNRLSAGASPQTPLGKLTMLSLMKYVAMVTLITLCVHCC